MGGKGHKNKTQRGRIARVKVVAGHPSRPAYSQAPPELFFAHNALDAAIYSKRIAFPIGAPVHNSKLEPDKHNGTDESSNDDDNSETDVVSRNHFGLPAAEETHTSTSHVHVTGGRGATGRRITDELNSDDEIIVKMKMERRTDKDIAQRLKDEGRVDYNVKSVGSRWKRIRTKLAEAKDKALDQHGATWKAQEDDALKEAFQAADKIVGRLKQEAEDSRWELVATKLRELVPTALYSRRAVEQRFTAIQEGTADTAPSLENGSSPSIQRPSIPQASMTAADSDLSLNIPTCLSLSHRIRFAASGHDSVSDPLPQGHLLPVHQMTREELRAELKARGVVRDGNKCELVATLTNARAGLENVRKSNKPADSSTLKDLNLKKRKRSDNDGDHEA